MTLFVSFPLPYVQGVHSLVHGLNGNYAHTQALLHKHLAIYVQTCTPYAGARTWKNK